MISAKYPREAAAIGRLLTGYSDLEIDLLHCVQVATGDFDGTLRAMFASRGETKRINSGAALGRPAYVTLNLEPEFHEAISAVRHCLLIRNQYAHHTFWDDNTGTLAIGDLEKVARDPVHQADLGGVTPNHVSIALLREQDAYFRYADEVLRWVNFEGRFRRGLLNTNPVIRPLSRPKPALHL
jgi:hypothetical protein